MEQLVVIGTSPAHDVSVVVGPFRSPEKAEQASQDLTAKGYNTETCPLVGDGTWQPERDLRNPEEAAGRVAWLNGGRRTGPLGEGERQRLRAYILGLNHTAAQADEAVKEIARILGRSA